MTSISIEGTNGMIWHSAFIQALAQYPLILAQANPEIEAIHLVGFLTLSPGFHRIEALEAKLEREMRIHGRLNDGQASRDARMVRGAKATARAVQQAIQSRQG